LKKTIVVNLFAGPGAGKSTSMAGIFCELKLNGVNCEMAPEYAKEKVWEGSQEVLTNQIYVFGKQLHNVQRLIGKVDVIITDSPIILSLIYAKNESKEFEDLVIEVFKRYDNMNYYLTRIKEYNPSGRNQTEEEAKVKDKEVLQLIHKYGIEHTTRESSRTTINEIVKDVLERLKENQ
jgi:hypothetical protein